MTGGAAMQLEQSGLGSWFSRFRGGRKRNARKSLQRGGAFSRRAWIEQLEERRLLVTRVWLDFGDFFGNQNHTDAFAGTGHLDIMSPNQTLATTLMGSSGPAPTGFGGVQEITTTF